MTIPPELEAAEALKDPAISAKAVGLRHVSDQKPGIRRKQTGKNFRYLDPDGNVLHDLAILRRIKSLAIPPAWTDVWICMDPNGHLQATGRDDRCQVHLPGLRIFSIFVSAILLVRWRALGAVALNRFFRRFR